VSLAACAQNKEYDSTHEVGEHIAARRSLRNTAQHRSTRERAEAVHDRGLRHQAVERTRPWHHAEHLVHPSSTARHRVSPALQSGQRGDRLTCSMSE